MSNYPAGVPISHPFPDGPTTRRASELQASIFKPMSDTVAALAGDRWWKPMKGGMGGGWVPFGGVWETPKWRRLGAVVMLKGLVKSGGTGTGNPIWTLPAALVPTQQTRQVVFSDGAAAIVRVDATLGVLYVSSYIGGSNASVSLDQVWWVIE